MEAFRALNMATSFSASSFTEYSFAGFPMLKISESQTPSLFSMIFMSPSMPSSTKVKQRFWEPPSTSLMGLPWARSTMNWVTTREEPSLAVSMLSSLGPIQLKGRKQVYFRPSCWP